jgi:hypothetical protein
MDKRVVIGYHKKNRDLVYRLDQDLVKRGLQVWIDLRDIEPGASRRKSIFDAIAKCDFFLAGLSPEFLADDFCRAQLFLARAYNRRILPILVSEEWPGNHVVRNLVEAGLTHSHAIKGLEELLYLDFSGRHDLTGGSYEKNFERLVDSIQPLPRPAPLNAKLAYFSYNWNDVNFANRLSRDVQLARGRVWIDTLAIQVGNNWRAAMYAGLREADQLILCLSPEAVRSENVRHEVLLANMRGLRILPVIPDRISNSEALRTELASAIEASQDMGALTDIEWFEPVPDYQTLLKAIKLALGLEAVEPTRRAGIFLSYRRADTQAMTGRIHEKLVENFGPDAVFMDVDTIPAGEDFAEYYQRWLRNEAAVMLVLIGDQWATIKSESDNNGRPRLHDEKDHVRIEVASALDIDNLGVIPVLVGNARMPSTEELPESLHPLIKRQTIKVRYDPDFGRDMTRLIDGLKRR